MAMYFVRTVCEFILLKSETGPPASIQDEILRVLAVFLDGFDIIVTGAESKDAQTRPVGVSPLSLFILGGDGSAMSSDS